MNARAPSPRWLAAVLLSLAALCGSAQAAPDLDTVLAGAQRSAENRARDVYRHPAQTLGFFGIEPDMVVVELWPGQGWYTEILAPWLRANGKLYAAHFPADSTAEYYQRGLAAFRQKLAAEPAVYDRVVLTELGPPEKVAIAPAGSADAVLTFRNMHNWWGQGTDAQVMQAAFAALKPGGVLGIVEHRAAPGATAEQVKNSGYMTEEMVIAAAQAAGFVLEAKSEINANPRDTKDYPKGVWTLPPRLALGEQDRAKYLAIGESDRMTLRFRKPAK
jgi:predicted methyltransferase